MYTVLVGNNIPDECREYFEKKSDRVILLPPFVRLQKGVSTHADMLLFYDGKRLLMHREYYASNKELFDSVGVEIITTDETIREEYPNDILFNAVLTKDKVLYSKTEYTSAYIKNLSREQVAVKQGYTACSTCRVTDNAFITTDIGLYRAYTKDGIDCLLMGKEDIVLEGYGCGFIGGATAVDRENVYFFGDVTKHSDYEKIKSFIEKYGKKIVRLGSFKLTDVGGAIIIYNNINN